MSRLEFIVRLVTVPRSIWPTPFAASRFSDGSKTELCGKKRETCTTLRNEPGIKGATARVIALSIA